jgi:hypothetical protein
MKKTVLSVLLVVVATVAVAVAFFGPFSSAAPSIRVSLVDARQYAIDSNGITNFVNVTIRFSGVKGTLNINQIDGECIGSSITGISGVDNGQIRFILPFSGPIDYNEPYVIETSQGNFELPVSSYANDAAVYASYWLNGQFIGSSIQHLPTSEG